MATSTARLGHVNLKVANLDRSVSFYCDVLGMHVTQLFPNQAAFLSYGDYHHDICVNTWMSKDGTPPLYGMTGLYHFAVLFEEREEFLKRIVKIHESGIRLDAIVDHGTSHAVYFRDPDENGIEYYWDRPADKWADKDGNFFMEQRPMTMDDLLTAK